MLFMKVFAQPRTMGAFYRRGGATRLGVTTGGRQRAITQVARRGRA